MVNRIALLVCMALLSPQLSALDCPERVFSEQEIAKRLEELRARYPQLPRAFSEQEVTLKRMNCLYVYYENDAVERSGKSQEFTFDMYGELMRYYVNES